MPKLRNYQDALARAAREPGNHVVVLPTGAGKTLISFDLIFTALLRHPRKIVVFLAPTILLVNQQHQEFRQETQKRGLSLETGLLAGGKRHNLGRCHVLFATPAASEQVCSTDELKSVSLLVMDEVHHAQAKKDHGSRHPYARIAAEYAVAPGHSRPKLLGLTASPGETLEQTRRLLKQLQAQLLQVTAPVLRDELSQTVPKAKLVISLVSCSPEFQTFMRDADRVSRALQQEQTQLLVDMASRLKHIAELSARVRCLCWGEAANLMDADLKEIPVDPRLSESWKLLLRSSAGVSPCFERLLAVLQEQKSSSQTSHGFRCIVFVETRTAAREMTRVLNFVSGSESAFRWLRPTCLLGHSKRGNDEDEESMTMAQQSKILADFRQGTTNCMVATSVAEEGIDVASCNLVVRMEPAHTVIKFIQARGRARFSNSHYVILCCNKDEEQLVSNLETREVEVKRLLADLEVPYVAENCWSASPRSGLAEPLLAFDPHAHEHDLNNLEAQQHDLGELDIDVEDLMPTQATVKRCFTDGRRLLDVMVHLVQHPQHVQNLPLMKVSQGSSLLLGRRSPEVEREVWYSADNRRCFMFKVIAPLCQWSKVHVRAVNWTDEFDSKLAQCPQTGDTWATDLRSIEDVRNQVIKAILGEQCEIPLTDHRHKRGKTCSQFDPGTDYVAQLNLFLQRLFRPSSGQVVAEYHKIATGTVHFPKFVMEVRIGKETWTGLEETQVKLAKQSAAYQALKALATRRPSEAFFMVMKF